MRGNEEEARD